ncbi:hypothetical protein SBA2_810003 [Acidobacteriia bacterium SbA2]|nr:hypothetical protein SBA2_810003 [Acidobacteriia bacterium SbA2]
MVASETILGIVGVTLLEASDGRLLSYSLGEKDAIHESTKLHS